MLKQASESIYTKEFFSQVIASKLNKGESMSNEEVKAVCPQGHEIVVHRNVASLAYGGFDNLRQEQTLGRAIRLDGRHCDTCHPATAGFLARVAKFMRLTPRRAAQAN